MARSFRSSLVLTLPLLAALAAIGALAWFVGRGTSPPETERADNPRVELTSEAITEVSTESQPLEARSAGNGVTRGDEKGASPTATGTGTLRIRVLDEATRAPIPDLGFSVFRERGGQKVLASGRTDASGRAELGEIEANTILVRTERKPPYAEQTGAVWLVPGATKELELLVGAGGALVGRVIDDLGRDIAEAEIWLNAPRAGAQPDARSGADGRFRIDCLASRPRSVWIVDGEMRPEAWEPVWLAAFRDNVHARKSALPVPAKDTDVGDFRLARATIYSGHLIDAGGKLVAGAVLSVRGDPMRGPADPDFRLARGDALSDGSGGFDLRSEHGPRTVSVWTLEGQRQNFPLPDAEPGERVEGVELRLGPETRFEFEFVDASGAPASIPPGSGRGPKGGNDLVRVYARCSDGGRPFDERRSSDPDGKWRLRLQTDPAVLRDFMVTVSGYQSIIERSESGFPALVQRRLVLTPFPTFRLRLVAKDPTQKLLDEPGGWVGVQICLADPKRHAAAGVRCCGLGASVSQPWRGEPTELVLSVRRQAPYWIYVRGPQPGGVKGAFRSLGYADEPSGGPVDRAQLGPFEPGPEVHELALDPADFARPPDEVRKPPERTAPGEEHFARLRARITDVRTGSGLPGAWISMKEVGAREGQPGGTGAQTDENGDVRDSPVLAGRWTIAVTRKGYERAQLGEREARERETLDLGTIGLEPRPRHRGRVVDADGAALAQVWLGVVSPSEMMRENGGLMSGPDGSFELFGEPATSFVLQTNVRALHGGWGSRAQRFVIEPWPDDEVKEIRLAKSRKVIVTIAGLLQGEGSLAPHACPAPGEPTGSCDHRTAGAPDHQALTNGLEIDSAPEGRRYALLLAPGRYQLWGSNVLHELPVTELEVAPGDTDLELTISAH